MPAGPAPGPWRSIATGQVLGYGRAGGGNPTSAGIPAAVAAIGAAAEQGDGRAAGGRGRGRGHRPGRGEDRSVHRQLSERLGRLGLGPRGAAARPVGHVPLGHPPARWVRPDRRHGKHRRPDPGRCAAPGGRRPGLAARRRRQRLLDRAPGGPGGGVGAGRAGTADRADAAGAGGAGDRRTASGSALPQVVSALYARRPVQLSEFAPLAFAAAARIRSPGRSSPRPPRRWPICSATVREPGLTGPVVVGGSVADPRLPGRSGRSARSARAARTTWSPVGRRGGRRGRAGPARSGVVVDEAIFERLRRSGGTPDRPCFALSGGPRFSRLA